MDKVAIQGYEGSFHQIAARNYFGEQVNVVECPTFREVARSVIDGESPWGIMAIENSIAGSIIPNYSILQDDRLEVTGEIYLQIKQNLMALPGVELSQIREVRSHPMALLQCVDFLDRYQWNLVETEDTALSAKHIARQRLTRTAAIASELAAELFGLEIIAPDIHSIKNNYTRFMVIRRREADNSYDLRANKASLYFKVDHRQGSLLEVLGAMNKSGVNMSKLQSYPIPSQPWHYLFHVDIEFANTDQYRDAIGQMKAACREVHVYGVYKKGDDLIHKC